MGRAGPSLENPDHLGARLQPNLVEPGKQNPEALNLQVIAEPLMPGGYR